MELEIIGLVIGFIIAMIVLNQLDMWSTSTLLKYQKTIAYNENFRNKLAEQNRQDNTKNEMNLLARKFMTKFGIEKGMKIFTLSFTIPYVIIICYFILTGNLPYIFTMVYSSFYAGALYVQIMRAFYSRKLLKAYGVGTQ